MTRRPSIVINDYAGHPFQIELSTEFSRRDLEIVHVYCTTNVTPRGDLSQRNGGPTIIGISTGGGFDKYNIPRRLLAELRYGFSSVRLLWKVRPDACLNSNVPVVSLAMITVASAILRIRAVLWLQDLQAGLVGFALGSDRRPAARTVAMVERWCVRHAEHVVTISPGFEREVRSMGIPQQGVTTIPNWAPIDDIPLRSRNNQWSTRHGLDDRLVFMYSGTLGLKHCPEALVALAQEMAIHDPDAEIVVVSEGVGAEWLSDQASKLGLDNITILPFQPFDVLPDVLATGDALVVLLEPDAAEFSVPSKVLTYLCAGRAVIGLMPATNAASKLVQDEALSGLVSEDLDGFIDSAKHIAADAAVRDDFGSYGRAYAEATFKISRIADDFLRVVCPTQGVNGESVSQWDTGVMT